MRPDSSNARLESSYALTESFRVALTDARLEYDVLRGGFADLECVGQVEASDFSPVATQLDVSVRFDPGYQGQVAIREQTVCVDAPLDEPTIWSLIKLVELSKNAGGGLYADIDCHPGSNGLQPGLAWPLNGLKFGVRDFALKAITD